MSPSLSRLAAAKETANGTVEERRRRRRPTRNSPAAWFATKRIRLRQPHAPLRRCRSASPSLCRALALLLLLLLASAPASSIAPAVALAEVAPTAARRRATAVGAVHAASSSFARPATTAPKSSSRSRGIGGAGTNEEEEKKQSKRMTNQAWRSGVQNAVASACAAACCKTLLQPVDAVKTVQQYYQQHGGIGIRALSLPAAVRLLRARPGGARNLYAGLGVTVLGSMPSVGLYFGVYSYCKQRLLSTERGRRRATLSVAVSAAIGNTVASFSRVPYEVAKQKLQMGLYDNTWSLLRDVLRPGMAAELLFPKGGVWIQMLRDVPYAVVTLLLYETLQQKFGSKRDAAATTTTTTTNQNGMRQSPWRDALLGGFAGGVGSWVTNPMDVVKTRLQTDSAAYGGSVAACAHAVWREGGAPAFLRGSLPRLLHKVPANALFFVFYEVFQRVLSVDAGGASGNAPRPAPPRSHNHNNAAIQKQRS